MRQLALAVTLAATGTIAEAQPRERISLDLRIGYGGVMQSKTEISGGGGWPGSSSSASTSITRTMLHGVRADLEFRRIPRSVGVRAILGVVIGRANIDDDGTDLGGAMGLHADLGVGPVIRLQRRLPVAWGPMVHIGLSSSFDRKGELCPSGWICSEDTTVHRANLAVGFAVSTETRIRAGFAVYGGGSFPEAQVLFAWRLTIGFGGGPLQQSGDASRTGPTHR